MNKLTWEELTPEQQEKWNQIAQHKSKELILWREIMKSGKCFMCGYEHNKTTSDIEFHLLTTHGIPPEMITGMLTKAVNSNK